LHHKSGIDYLYQKIGTTKARKAHKGEDCQLESTKESAMIAPGQEKPAKKALDCADEVHLEYGESFSNHSFFLRAPLCAFVRLRGLSFYPFIFIRIYSSSLR
jgi:hypothetical protein